MIEINDVSKQFDEIKALSHIHASISQGHVFGLIGTNGAGKSTLMRCMCGIYQPDTGSITLDGQNVFANPVAQQHFFFISDDQFYISNGTPGDMSRFYKTYYPAFDSDHFEKLLSAIGLKPDRKINTFSKGMKKQLSVLLGICSGASYLLCDETFDGLDPVMRQTVKRLFIEEIEDRKLTPVIASHNLRELEDICDHVGLLHKGGILFAKDLDEMKLGIHRLQCVFSAGEDYDRLKEQLEILHTDNRGSLFTLTIRGERERVDTAMRGLTPIFYEILPLSLEEIFISETEVQGYDFKNLFI